MDAELSKILLDKEFEEIRDLSHIRKELQQILEKVDAKIRKLKRRKYI